jgi:hypothetical protein
VDNDPYNGHEYVDLGLPSGTLWAKCNVGAASETDGGLYFSWGSTQGYTFEQINNGEHEFSAENDVWGSNGDDYDRSITKYNYTDGLTELLPEDDAARVNMGGEWRMPSGEEYQELLDNTTVASSIVNNVRCVVFTSKHNGNEICFPLCEFIMDGNIYPAGIGTLLWSSTLDGGYREPERAIAFSAICESDDVFAVLSGGDSSTAFRYLGLFVRAVFKK